MANKRKSVPRLSQTQRAYLAGLIDGEAHIGCQKQMQKKGKTHRYEIQISFGMVTVEPLKTIGEWLNLKPRLYKSKQENRSPQYRLHIPKQMAINVLNQCLPYLLEKKRQAQLIFEIERIRQKYSPQDGWCGRGMPPEWEQEVEPVYQELRSLKSNKRPGGCRPKKNYQHIF